MTDHRISEVKTIQKETEQERRILTLKATQLIWLLFGSIEVLIALRIGLKLIGANPASPIAAFIFGISSLFLFPFNGVTGIPTVGGMVLEIPSVITMVVYVLIAWTLDRAIWVIFYRPR